MRPTVRRTYSNRSNTQPTSNISPNANAVTPQVPTYLPHAFDFPPLYGHQLIGGNGRLEIHPVYFLEDIGAVSYTTIQTTNPLAFQPLLCHTCIRRSIGSSESNPIIINDDGIDDIGILENGQPCQNCIQNVNVYQRPFAAAENEYGSSIYCVSSMPGLDLNLPLPEYPSPLPYPNNPPPSPPPQPLPMGRTWIRNHPPPPSPTLFPESEGWYVNVPMNINPNVLDPASYLNVVPSFPPIIEGGGADNVVAMDVLVDEDLSDDEYYDDISGDEYDDFEIDLQNLTYEELLEVQNTIGAVPTGLTLAQIRQGIKRFAYCLARNTSSCNEQCCICLDEFCNRDEVAQLGCNHLFHYDCIKNWLVQKNNCPICKRTALRG